MQKMPGLISLFLMLALVTTSSASSVTHTKRLAPLPVEDALRFKYIGHFGGGLPLSVSPDGKYVAYTIQDASRVRWWQARSNNYLTDTGVFVNYYATDVYVTNVKTGETRNISEGVGSSYLPSWSPDSGTLAFFSDRDGQLRVWSWVAATGQLRRISDAPALPDILMPPQWVDEGRKLLVPVLREGLTYAEQNKLNQLQVESVKPHIQDSTVEVYSHEPEPHGPSKRIQLLQGYSGANNPIYKDLAQIDVVTGRYRRVVPNIGGWFSVWLRGVSADGRFVLVTQRSGVSSRNYNDELYDILVYEIDSGRQVMVVRDVPMFYGFQVSWAPSGHRFAYVTSSRTSYFRGKRGLNQGPREQSEGGVFVADVGGTPVGVFSEEHPDFGGTERPIWSADGGQIYLVGGNRVWQVDIGARTTRAVTRIQGASILNLMAVAGGTQLWQPTGTTKLFIRVRNTQAGEEIHEIDTTSGVSAPMLQAEQSYDMAVFDAAHSTAPAVFAAMDIGRPLDLYVTENFRKVRRLTQLNPIFEQYEMGASRLVSWKGRNGEEYKGSLLLPAGYEHGKRYPLVVWQRPSNRGSHALNNFGLHGKPDYQLLATRGYAVFYPDFPMTRNLDIKEAVENVLLPGVDRIVEMGVADADRIGLAGLSWGGYSSLMILTMTDRFKVAMAEAGYGDAVAHFSRLYRNGAARSLQETVSMLGGAPWDAREAYTEYSPIFNLDRIKTPLMIIHSRGDGDYGVPQWGVDGVFVGLRYLNRTVTMLLYDGGHGTAMFSYPDRVDCWIRQIAWYDRFLK